MISVHKPLIFLFFQLEKLFLKAFIDRLVISGTKTDGICLIKTVDNQYLPMIYHLLPFIY